MAEPALASARIELLGSFRVAVGTRAVPAEAWRRSKAAGLVKLLALAPGHRLHREQALAATAEVIETAHLPAVCLLASDGRSFATARRYDVVRYRPFSMV